MCHMQVEHCFKLSRGVSAAAGAGHPSAGGWRTTAPHSTKPSASARAARPAAVSLPLPRLHRENGIVRLAMRATHSFKAANVRRNAIRPCRSLRRAGQPSEVRLPRPAAAVPSRSMSRHRSTVACTQHCGVVPCVRARANPSIEGTSTSGLRPLAAAPHVKR